MDGEEEIKPYKLTATTANGTEELLTSKHYTGDGTAEYPSGDMFAGDFVDGVSFI